MSCGTLDSSDCCTSTGKTIVGGWSGDKYDVSGGDDARGGVREADIGCIDVLTGRKDPLALEGKETLISLVPVAMTQLKRGCPFDGLDQGVLDRAMNDNSATRVNDEANGSANSSWNLNDSWEEASCVGREEG